MRQLGLPPIDARELMVLVNYRNLQAQEIDELVAALADTLGAEGRVHFIEWLWEIVVADRIVTVEETGLIATLATRLGVEPRVQEALAARFARSTAA